MQEITITPLEALHKLIGVASMIDTNECKDEAMYNALQGALVVAQTELAMAPKQEAPKGDAQKNPQANTWPAEIYLQAGDTDVESHLSYDAAMHNEVTWAAESIDWNDVRYIRADLAAPAAANGAQYLTRVADFLADAVGGYSGGLADRIEEVIKQLRLDAGCGACGDACKGMTCRLQDESPSAVAAGSDAALVDAKHLVDITTAIMSQHGLIDHLSIGATQAFCDDLCAALSGAKGN